MPAFFIFAIQLLFRKALQLGFWRVVDLDGFRMSLTASCLGGLMTVIAEYNTCGDILGIA